jgi:hypothetical protein
LALTGCPFLLALPSTRLHVFKVTFYAEISNLRYLHTPGGKGAWTAFVQPLSVKLWFMKLKNIIPQRQHKQFIHQFGQAKLVKLPNGQHELLGGSDSGLF